MITPKEALDSIFREVSCLPSERVNLNQSAGRVLAHDIFASCDLPPFDNSAMDGYAVKLRDVADASQNCPAHLKLHGVYRAGRIAREELALGEAIKIMTGAPLPQGTEAVVMKELTQESDTGMVQILRSAKNGEHIRRQGEDVHSGDLLLESGSLIRPYEIALLAAQGITSVDVVRKPRVSIVSTGDELLEPFEKLAPGKIRNSNGISVSSELLRWGCTPVYQGIIEDNPEDLKSALKHSADISDMVLVTGGVSVGDFDYTRMVLEKLALRVVFWKVAIKPGKPLLFGLLNGKPVFGLPGNPISVLVCLEEFVRPALEKMQGYTPRYPGYHLRGKVKNEYFKEETRQQYLFCQAEENSHGFELTVIRPQGSAMLGMACKANALAIAPIGLKQIQPGMDIAFRWLK